MKNVYCIETVRQSGAEFYYFYIGKEVHYKPTCRIWTSHRLVRTDQKGQKYVQFPAKAIITQTAKGNYVLKPSEEHITLDILVDCGYRGTSEFTFETSPVVELKYYVYETPRGRCGISEGRLATFHISQFPVIYSWKKTGRTYGAPKSGRTQVLPDGEEEEIPPKDEELEALLQ